MASIINAGTSGGITTSADLSGILQVQTGGVLAAQVTNAGGGSLVSGSTNPILAIPGTANNYIQSYLINNTNGINASADLVVYPHNGLDSSGWLDMGITSQSFSQSTYNVTGGNEGYLFMSAPAGSATTGNLIFATDSTGSANSIQFFTAGFNQGKTLPKLAIDGASGLITGSAKGNTPGLYQTSQYYRLNSTFTGANVATAQPILGVGVLLAANTVYEFELVFQLAKATGATSHTFGILFGGTAVVNNIDYSTLNAVNTTALSTITAGNLQSISFASLATVTGAIASNTTYWSSITKGTVSVSTAGTFIPQYSCSVAPGGAYTTQIGSYMKISPIGASGANTSIGTWA